MFGGIKTLQTTRIDETMQSSAIRDNPDDWRVRRAELQVLNQFNDWTISKSIYSIQFK